MDDSRSIRSDNLRSTETNAWTAGPRSPSTVGEPADELAAALQGATLGGYRIIRYLGGGGMGCVFEAEQESPRRSVALKVMRAANDSIERRRRFVQESHVLGRLQHPGIAQVYEAGVAETDLGPLPYFAMEFIRGRTLRDFAATARWSVNERLALIARIADALEHAHESGVVHRDLKPSNILVTSDGYPKILDFGVARATGSDLRAATLQTDFGQLVGTLPYMSPEQASGDPSQLDTRSDIYSLGVVAYELLAGRLPYELPRSLPDALRIIREEEPSRISTVASGTSRAPDPIRGEVETIIGKALEKDKLRRYPTASAFGDDIRRYLNHEAIHARPPSTWYQATKFAQRNRGLVSGLGVAFLVLLAGLVATTLLYFEEAAAQSRASQALAKERVAREEATLAAIRLATERGDWRELLLRVDSALAERVGDPVALRLSRVLALDGLQRYDDALAEAEHLLNAVPNGPFRGEILLWYGDLLMVDPDRREEALEYLRSAVDDPALPPADRSYAEGFLVETMPEAAAAFRASIEANPFQFRSRTMHGIINLFSGRRGDALRDFETCRALFPSDTTINLGIAAHHILSGNAEAAEAAIDRMTGISDEFRTLVRDATRLGAEIARLGIVEELGQPVTFEDGLKLSLQAIGLAQRASLVLDSDSTDSEAALASLCRRFPKALENSWGQVVPGALAVLLQRVTPDTLDSLRNACRVNPEAMTLLLTSMAMLDDPALHEESIQLAWQAAEAPAVFDVRTAALMVAVTYRATSQLGKTAPLPAEERRRVREAILELVGVKMTPFYRHGLALCALQLREHGLASILIQGLLGDDPENAEYRRLQRRIDDEIRSAAAP